MTKWDCANGYHASSRILTSVFDCQLGIFDLMGSYFSPSSPACSKIRSLLQDETQPSITEAIRALFHAPYIAIMDNEYCGRNYSEAVIKIADLNIRFCLWRNAEERQSILAKRFSCRSY